MRDKKRAMEQGGRGSLKAGLWEPARAEGSTSRLGHNPQDLSSTSSPRPFLDHGDLSQVRLVRPLRGPPSTPSHAEIEQPQSLRLGCAEESEELNHARVHKGIFCTGFRMGQFKQNLRFKPAGHTHSPLSLSMQTGQCGACKLPLATRE